MLLTTYSFYTTVLFILYCAILRTQYAILKALPCRKFWKAHWRFFSRTGWAPYSDIKLACVLSGQSCTTCECNHAICGGYAFASPPPPSGHKGHSIWNCVELFFIENWTICHASMAFVYVFIHNLPTSMSYPISGKRMHANLMPLTFTTPNIASLFVVESMVR